MIKTKLFTTIFIHRTVSTNGHYLIVSGHDRVNKGVCYRGVSNVRMRLCKTRVFRASGGRI